MLEAAGTSERVVDGLEIVGVFIESGANGLEIAKRHEEFERAREKALLLKQLQQPFRTRVNEAVAHRRRYDRAGVDQHLRARPASEPLFSLRIARVGVGAGGHSQQAALTVPVVVVPRQQRGILRQQLLQAYDVVVVNDASRLRRGPLEAFAEALAHFSGEISPTGEPVLTREYELSVPQREGSISRDLLGLFAKGLERRTIRERFRGGHCALLRESPVTR